MALSEVTIQRYRQHGAVELVSKYRERPNNRISTAIKQQALQFDPAALLTFRQALPMKNSLALLDCAFPLKRCVSG